MIELIKDGKTIKEAIDPKLIVLCTKMYKKVRDKLSQWKMSVKRLAGQAV